MAIDATIQSRREEVNRIYTSRIMKLLIMLLNKSGIKRVVKVIMVF